MRRLVFVSLLATLAACRVATQPATPGTPAAAATNAGPSPTPLRARCDADRAQAFPEWNGWANERLFETTPEWDLTEVKSGGPEVQRLLRQGLEACDWRAPIAIMEGKVRSLVPELRDLLDGANISSSLISPQVPQFRLTVVNTLNALDPETDYAPHLVPLLSTPIDKVRLGAVFNARYYRLASVRAPLLDRVRDDPKAQVRRQAAESLFVLAGVRPPYVHGHKGLTDVIDAETPAARARAVKMVEQLLGGP
jgi:hypothetical protein